MRDEQTDYSCAAAVAIDLLQGKWKMKILCLMQSGPVRLGELTRLIPAASKKVLTESLRKLEACGLVVRRDLSGQVRHVEYELSEAMKSETHILLNGLARWAKQFGEENRTMRD
jgi:DNA-binding HxlR family transcriptional regulator